MLTTSIFKILSQFKSNSWVLHKFITMTQLELTAYHTKGRIFTAVF